jgi:hypothetical protein
MKWRFWLEVNAIMAPLLEIDGLYKSVGALMAINGLDSYLDDEEI